MTEVLFYKVSYLLSLGPPVPLGASGDEKSPSLTVTGDPAGSMAADNHLFRVFSECTSPCKGSITGERCPLLVIRPFLLSFITTSKFLSDHLAVCFYHDPTLLSQPTVGLHYMKS